MAQRIGNGTPTVIVDNMEYVVDGPALLTLLATSEKHQKKLSALHIFTQLLQAASQRAVQIQDPVLLDILARMKLVSVPIKQNKEVNFHDI